MNTAYSKKPADKKVLVTREFAAPRERVWQAWTESEILNQWWAPKPWRAETRSMDFKEGGYWLYSMVGPEGERHWARMDYKKIQPLSSFTAWDSFCDEQGTTNTSLPSADWTVKFSSTSIGTKVEVEISFAEEEDMRKLLEMGFEEGFRMAHENLDALLAK